jgi:hypothetical protein
MRANWPGRELTMGGLVHPAVVDTMTALELHFASLRLLALRGLQLFVSYLALAYVDLCLDDQSIQSLRTMPGEHTIVLDIELIEM